MSDSQRSKIVSELRLRSFSSRYADPNDSVSTSRGDEGHTQLLFGREVQKWHPRIRLVGKLDTLSSFLNLCKVDATECEHQILKLIQENLVYVMGEIATHEEDTALYAEYYHKLTQSDIDQLQEMTTRLESKGAQFVGWVGSMKLSKAFAETARTLAREAESMAWELVAANRLRKEIARWLNRLSDLLWAFARQPKELGE